LGAGAFGEVYLVEKGGKYYAMKQLRKRKYSGLMNFVITEKEVQRKIRNRFIVKLRYAFQTYNKLYLITDYCPGGDFRALINTNKRISEDIARLYLAEILVAITEIHKNGIIHRDIKPDNILIDEGGHACLTDFGLAKEGMFEKKLT
jgi:serine/threonine protein kinase